MTTRDDRQQGIQAFIDSLTIYERHYFVWYFTRWALHDQLAIMNGWNWHRLCEWDIEYWEMLRDNLRWSRADHPVWRIGGKI